MPGTGRVSAAGSMIIASQTNPAPTATDPAIRVCGAVTRATTRGEASEPTAAPIAKGRASIPVRNAE